MDFYEVIEKRTSIKKFKSTPIQEEKLDRIIKCTMMAPSWKNKAGYKLIIVDDYDKKSSIAKAINNKTKDAENAVLEAPMVVIIVGDKTKKEEVNGKDTSLIDSSIAFEHLILAATREGYGTCWIAAFDEEKIKSTLNIPTDFTVVALTPLGEIEEFKEHYDAKEVSDYIYKNNWCDKY